MGSFEASARFGSIDGALSAAHGSVANEARRGFEKHTAVRPSAIALRIVARAECVLLRGQYEFAVFHRDGSTWIGIGVQMMLAAVQFVDDVESGRLFLEIIDRVATLLRRRVCVVLLSVLLNLVAGVATDTRTSDSCQGLAASATNLMSQDAPD